MDESKMVNFVRFGDSASTLQPLYPADTVREIVERIAEDLGINAKGSYILIDKASNVQLVNDIYNQVEDMASVLVTPDETGGR